MGGICRTVAVNDNVGIGRLSVCTGSGYVCNVCRTEGDMGLFVVRQLSPDRGKLL